MMGTEIKTAEEILKDYVPAGSKNNVIAAMREFAAQEVAKDVEAYKKRLRGALNALPAGLVNRAEFQKLIDTVK